MWQLARMLFARLGKRQILSTGCMALLVVVTVPAQAQPKLALVVGNNSYLRLPSLGTAVNDALAVGSELSNRGFAVTQKPDVTFSDFEVEKTKFLAQIRNGGVAVFYFAGHGIQVEGRNYVLPVDFAPGSEKELEEKGISIPKLLDEIESAKPKLAIVILDACRDNPFIAPETRSVKTRGLAELGKPVPEGTLIIYSASSNQSALDTVPGQNSKNSLFTTELLSAVREPNLEIRDLAKRVRFSVMERAKGVGYFQVPALYDNLSQGEFYFSRADAKPSTAAAQLPRRIRIIVPFAEKAPTDVMVRTIAPRIARVLATEVAVENQLDIVGDTVANAVGSGPADGSVLLVGNFVQSSRRALRGDKNLSPIAMLADVPLSISANPEVRANSIQELISSARKRGKPWNMGAGLVGSVEDMCAREMQKKVGGDVINVTNTPGLGPTIKFLLDGKLDLVCTSAPNMAPQIQRKAAAVVAEVRYSSGMSRNLIAQSSAAAQGYDVIAPNWLGVFAPAGVQTEVIGKLAEGLRTALSAGDMPELLSRYGAQPPSAQDMSPSGLEAAIKLGSTLQAR